MAVSRRPALTSGVGQKRPLSREAKTYKERRRNADSPEMLFFFLAYLNKQGEHEDELIELPERSS